MTGPASGINVSRPRTSAGPTGQERRITPHTSSAHKPKVSNWERKSATSKGRSASGLSTPLTVGLLRAAPPRDAFRRLERRALPSGSAATGAELPMSASFFRAAILCAVIVLRLARQDHRTVHYATPSSSTWARTVPRIHHDSSSADSRGSAALADHQGIAVRVLELDEQHTPDVLDVRGDRDIELAKVTDVADMSWVHRKNLGGPDGSKSGRFASRASRICPSVGMSKMVPSCVLSVGSKPRSCEYHSMADAMSRTGMKT